jgi:multidrug efflux system membrane fusion protein
LNNNLKHPRIRGAVIVLVLLAAGATWHHFHSAGAQASGKGGFSGMPGMPGMMDNKPVPVESATAKTQNFPITLSEIGTVTAKTTVTVHTLVNGTLQEVFFKEGQSVHKGDLLAKVDSRPYEVALTQAQGTLAKDKALLENAQTDLTRYENLAKVSATTGQTLETQKSLVRQYGAAVKTDEGAVAADQLNITYSRVVAPVDGRVGLRQVDPGNLVQTSDTSGIVVLTEVNPITVVFSVAQRDLDKLLARVQNAQGDAGAADGLGYSSIPVQAWNQEHTRLLATGKLLAVDNEIDTTTGTAKVKAIFDNSQGALFPNEFVNVKLEVDNMADATVIPSGAAQHGSQGSFVWVIKPDNTVTVRPIQTLEADGDFLPVLSGLKPGEIVAMDGFDRLRESGKVLQVTAASREVHAKPAHAASSTLGQPGPQAQPGKASSAPANKE